MARLPVLVALAATGCELFGFYDSPPTECRGDGCWKADGDGDGDDDADSDGDSDSGRDSGADRPDGGSADAALDAELALDAGLDAEVDDGICPLGESCDADGGLWGAYCDRDGICRLEVYPCADGDAGGLWHRGTCCTGCWDEEDVRCLPGQTDDSCGREGYRCADCRIVQCSEGVNQTCGFPGEFVYWYPRRCDIGSCAVRNPVNCCGLVGEASCDEGGCE